MEESPILRLSIPLATGVFLAEWFRGSLPEGVCVTVLLVLLVGMGYGLFVRTYRRRWVFGVGMSLVLMVAGALLVNNRWQQVRVAWQEEAQTYVGIVQDIPVEKARTLQCRTRVDDKDVYVYIRKDSLAKQIRMGGKLVFHARISPPSNEGVQVDFDYARYLYHQGISGTAFVPSGHWTLSDDQSRLTLRQKARQIRERIVGMYREWGIGEEQLPVLSALTIGHQAELDAETRAAYSKAGIAHVLALSGMHIAIIWLMLSFLLKPLERTPGLRALKWFLSTLFLWTFAFVAGLEASVVRAVIMCMLMELGKLMDRKPLSMNTLAVAALFMLLYNPFNLFDVGFQLSFVAVASILLVCPFLLRLWRVEHPVGRWVWSTLAVSVAAQLGTAPLVMYYFSTFSVYFLLANLLVAVLVPLIIYGCALAFLLVAVPLLHGWTVGALDTLVALLNKVAMEFSQLPYATLSWTRMNGWEVLLLYVWLALLLGYAGSRKRMFLIALLGGLATLLAVRLLVLSGIFV